MFVRGDGVLGSGLEHGNELIQLSRPSLASDDREGAAEPERNAGAFDGQVRRWDREDLLGRGDVLVLACDGPGAFGAAAASSRLAKACRLTSSSGLP